MFNQKFNVLIKVYSESERLRVIGELNRFQIKKFKDVGNFAIEARVNSDELYFLAGIAEVKLILDNGHTLAMSYIR